MSEKQPIYTTHPDIKIRTAAGYKSVFAFLTNIPITPGHFNMFCAWNKGKDYGQSVPHFHLHIVPRKLGDEGIDEYEPCKFLYRPGSREISPENELVAIAELLRESTNI